MRSTHSKPTLKPTLNRHAGLTPPAYSNFRDFRDFRGSCFRSTIEPIRVNSRPFAVPLGVLGVLAVYNLRVVFGTGTSLTLEL